MAEVATIRRWQLNEGFEERDLLALVHEQLIPAYRAVPGVLRQHLFRTAGLRSYVALTFWESQASLDQWTGAGGQAWRDQYRDVLARWLEMMSFREELDADVLVSS